MEDEVIAGAVVSIVTGLVRKVRKMGEAGIVITLAIVAGTVGLLWWASGNWGLMETIYTAVKAVVLTIAASIGIYESSKQKGATNEQQDDRPDPGGPAAGAGGSGAGNSPGGSGGRIDVPQLLDRGRSG